MSAAWESAPLLNDPKAEGAARPLWDAAPKVNEPGQQQAVTRDAVRTNPDEAAEVARLRKRYPTPDEVIARNLRDVKLQAAVDDAEKVYQTSPALARAMREPSLARQSHDDLPTLARIESGFAAVAGAGAAQATLGVSEAIWRTPDAASRLTGYLASLPERAGLPWWANPIRGVQDTINIVGKGQLPYFGKLFSGTTDVAEKVNDASKALQDRGTFGDAFADLGAMSQNADLALAHALRGNGKPLADVVTDPRYFGAFISQAAPSLVMAWKSGGSLPFIGWLEGMEQSSSAADFEKRTGQKVSDADFAQAFVQTATVNALLERYGLDKVVGAKGKGMASILKAMFAEGGTEGLQQVNTNVAEMLSFNPEKNPGEGVVGSVMGGAGSGGGGAAARSAAVRVAEAVQARELKQIQAQAAAQGLAGNLQTALDSKLRERNPEAFREVLGQMAEQAQEDGSDPTVYVDAEVLNQLAPEVQQLLPGEVLAQLREAINAGGVVGIPMADAMTIAPGSPLEQVLVEHGRIGDPEAATQAEAKADGERAMQLLGEAAQRAVNESADAAAFQASSDRVREGLLGQLSTLGQFRPAINEGYATWAAAFYTTMAGRTGMTPEAFAAKYPLKIVGQTGAARETRDGRGLSEIVHEWDTVNRNSRADEWFEGANANAEAQAGFADALANGGADVRAHGMAKAGTLSKGINDLMAMLANGLDPARAGGRLHYAPLTTPKGAATASTTPGGSAYSDGPFMLLARPGQEFTGKLEGVGAILVNQAHADIVPALREAIHAIRPDIMVEAYSEAGGVVKALTSGGMQAGQVLEQGGLEPGATINETDPYETDLFGNPLPAPAGKPRRARPGSAGVSRNVQPEPAVPGDTPAPAGDYGVRTVVGVQAERTLGAATINSAADAAAATQYLYRSAVERFDGIVTDKDGKPLAIIGGFKGGLAQVSVMPPTLMGEAIRVPGAAFVWFSHNHPSGSPELSSADESLSAALVDVFRGSGIEPRGLLAVADGAFSHVDEDGDIMARGLPIPAPASAGAKVPAIEREQLPAKAEDRPRIGSPSEAKVLAREYYAQARGPGVLLFDTQMRVSAWVPLPAEATGELRGTGGLAAIYRAVSEANAGSALIIHGGELDVRVRGASAAQNVGAALNRSGARALDIINTTTGRSAAESGLEPSSSQLYQQSRGTFNPQTLELALSPNADLSTFFHETGHFFLEVMADLASQPDALAGVADDMAALLKWFGISGEPAAVGARWHDVDLVAPLKSALPDGVPAGLDITAVREHALAGTPATTAAKRLAQATGLSPSQAEAVVSAARDAARGANAFAVWRSMTLEQQRPYHERFAESVEQYVIEGKAPSAELVPLMQKWRQWILSVYQSLSKFLTGNTAGPSLSPEVRQVLDRMLASSEQIAQAEEAAGLMPDETATGDAIAALTARSVRDVKWTINARSRALKALQKEAATLRRPVRIEARREVMTQPVYRLWSFLTAKRSAEDLAKTPGAPKKAGSKGLDPATDSLLVAIAKLGGLTRQSAESMLGVHPDFFNTPSGVFGKPIFRATAGMSADAMGEALAEAGYLLPSESGRYDLQELEALIDAELRGSPQYSIAKDYAQANDRAGEGVDLAALAAGRFDLGDLRTMNLPAGAIERLEAMRMTLKTGGIHPDIVADGFGFANGEQMIAALLESEAPLAAVEGLTDQRMLEQHGDLATPKAREAAANAAIHNEARARSLATELKAQADALGARTDTGNVNAKGSRITVNALVEAAKRYATQVVQATPIKALESRAKQYAASERRAAKRWLEATGKGDTAAAIKAKQDQVLAHATTRALLEAQAEAKKAREFFKEVTKGNAEKLVDKGRDPDMVAAARAILAAYGVGSDTGKKDALDYLALVERNDPEVFAALQPSIAGALLMAQPLDALTMGQLQSLHEEVQSLWFNARRSRQMEVDGRMLDLDDGAAELEGRMDAKGVPEAPGRKGALTPSQLAGRTLQGALSFLRRVEQWAEGMDGKIGGPFWRLVFLPIKKAADAYRDARVNYRKKYQALVDAVAPSLRKGLIEAPELGYTFGTGHNGIGHSELLHAILHTGNESNRRKLLLGREWATKNEDGSLNTDRWDAFIRRMQDEGVLGKVHYDFAQSVWDLLEETKPLAQKAHREVFGRYFDEIAADAFATPFGEYRGGYVPAMADPLLSGDADKRAIQQMEKEGMAHAFPTTNKGFTKGRVEYNRPLMLDLRSIGRHIDKVLLFSYMEPAVRDVARLLAHKRVSGKLNLIDPTAITAMLDPWLMRSATQTVETPVIGDTGVSRFASAARRRAGMALMFANVSNAIQQVTGFVSAFTKLKTDGLESHMMRSAASMLAGGPKKMAEAVAELSPFMRHRMQNEIAVLTDNMDDIVLAPSLYRKAQNFSAKHAYFLQTAIDNVMGPVIWTSGYNAALTKGMTEAEAVDYADSLIRQTQNSTLPEDVSRFETGSPWMRIFTQFVGYFNNIANTNGTALMQIRDEVGIKRGLGRLSLVVFMGLLAPLWVAEAIATAMKGGPDDEDQDGYLDDWIARVLGMGTIKGLLAMVPVAGPVVMAAANRFNDNPADDRMSLSPVISLLEGSGGVAVHVYKAAKGEEINQRQAARDVATLVNMVTGIPTVALSRPVGYVLGVQQGRIEPTSGADAVRGLVTGTASPESKQR